MERLAGLHCRVCFCRQDLCCHPSGGLIGSISKSGNTATENTKPTPWWSEKRLLEAVPLKRKELD